MKVMMVSGTLSGIMCLIFWLPLEWNPSNASIAAFAAIYGFVSGGYVTLFSPCVAKLCRGKLQDLGVTMGVFFIVIAFASVALRRHEHTPHVD